VNALDVPSAAAEITTVQPFAADVDADDNGGTSAGKAVAATNETVQGGVSGPMPKSKGAWGEGVDHDEPRTPTAQEKKPPSAPDPKAMPTVKTAPQLKYARNLSSSMPNLYSSPKPTNMVTYVTADGKIETLEVEELDEPEAQDVPVHHLRRGSYGALIRSGGLLHGGLAESLSDLRRTRVSTTVRSKLKGEAAAAAKEAPVRKKAKATPTPDSAMPVQARASFTFM